MSLDDINNMADSFAQMDDKEAFIKAQHKAICDLSRKVKALEEERNHLKHLLEQATPVLQSDNEGRLLATMMGNTEEELICRAQISKLNNVSATRELTLEECRKLEIYAKILNGIKNKDKSISVEVKKLKEDELLNLLNDGNVNT